MDKDKVRFGIVGLGSWGRVPAEVYSTHPASLLIAVCDLDKGRAGEIAATYGAKRIYTDYYEMMRGGLHERTGSDSGRRISLLVNRSLGFLA